MIDAGGQVAIVYPIVEDPEQEKRSVVSAFADWERHFPGLCGMAHGQMKEQETIDAIAALKSGANRTVTPNSATEFRNQKRKENPCLAQRKSPLT